MLGSTWQAMDSGAKTGDGILLQDLKGNFSNEDNLQMAYVDDSGMVQFVNCYYFTVDEGGMDQDGWYNEDYEYVGDSQRIPIGTACWFLSADDSKAITTAGQVYGSNFTHTFDEPVEMVCLAFPVEFNPNAVSWTGLTNEDNIQVSYVDDSGMVQFINCYYFTVDEGGMDEDAWYNEDYEKIESAITVPGQGFWLMIADPENATLIETSPLK